jgi:2'-5' RNA ligase
LDSLGIPRALRPSGSQYVVSQSIHRQHVMPDSIRTFVAIAIPEPLDRTLAACQTKLAPEAPGFRWTVTQPLHATLAFLGDVKNNDLTLVCDSIAAAVGGFEPIKLALEGLGAFPSAVRPRVIWAGLTTTSSAASPLVELQKAVIKAVAHSGYRPDDEHRFHPHVTLGRTRGGRTRPADLTALLERHKRLITGTFIATEVVTYSSTPGSAGPVYTALARARLKCEKEEPTA